MKPIDHNILSAAKRWAAANRSDPFAFSTAVAHARSGISSMSNEKGLSGYYDAEEYVEKRLTPDGDEFFVTMYKNMIRP